MLSKELMSYWMMGNVTHKQSQTLWLVNVWCVDFDQKLALDTQQILC